MLRSWEHRHALVGDDGKLRPATLRELRLCVRQLPSATDISTMPHADLVALRAEITALNCKCCADVRSWTPSRSSPARLPPHLASNVTDLQRVLQERLRRSLTRDNMEAQSNASVVGSSQVGFEPHPADFVPPHAGQHARRFPSLSMPDLRSHRVLSTGGREHRSLNKRLAREARRRDHGRPHGGHRSRRAARVLCAPPFANEGDDAHRMRQILHCVLERDGSSDEFAADEFLYGAGDMYDKDESYLYSD